MEGLIKKGILSRKDAGVVLKSAKERDISFEEALREVGVTKESILSAKTGNTSIPTRVLDNTKVAFGVLEHIPEESARHYSMVPLRIEDGVLEVGMTDPSNIEAIDALNFLTRKKGLPFKVFLISDEDLQKILKMYDSLG